MMMIIMIQLQARPHHDRCAARAVRRPGDAVLLRPAGRLISAPAGFVSKPIALPSPPPLLPLFVPAASAGIPTEVTTTPIAHVCTQR